MIYSMTGYGIARAETPEALIITEIKTLNSKFFDLQIKIPKELNDRDQEIRNFLSDKLKRGKVYVGIDYQQKVNDKGRVTINKELLKHYFSEVESIKKELGLPSEDYFKTILGFPDVLNFDDKKASEEVWLQCKPLLEMAVEECIQFRGKEGNTLAANLMEYIHQIGQGLTHVESLDPARIEKIRYRIQNNLHEIVGKDKIDTNRFEQELIYYIEKIDICEEKVRLKTHLEYFSEIIKSEDSPGKKLGFVAQEIGREINTIGSKANDAEIQKAVINMKEALEKIKEQLLNLM